MNLDEQQGHDNGHNSKDQLENKKKSQTDKKADLKPPNSSIAKESGRKQTRHKRQK